MTELEKKIGYSFKDLALLKEALTHSSFANEHGRSKMRCNERLEFLGDSVLSIAVSDYIFKKYPDTDEGELTRERANLVCEGTLAKVAAELNLGDSLMLGKGELKNKGGERPSILADCCEAVIAAIYLDGGMDSARAFVMRFIIRQEKELESARDYKTELQEIIQKNPEERVRYVVVSEDGPDHDKSFTVEVHLNSNVIGSGTGRSKKQAEQNAAQEALALMGL
ncbi:MAG: ribonuclease III [Oscillospiraceae bacterium]